MKIKILNTGQIVDAMVNKEGVANFINEHDKFHFLNDKEYEIIPEPRQPKFQIGDKVTYLPTSMFSTGGYIFEITRIVIDSDCIMYGSDSSSGHMEGELTLHTEPEKPKTEIRYQYIAKKEKSETLSVNHLRKKPIFAMKYSENFENEFLSLIDALEIAAKQLNDYSRDCERGHHAKDAIEQIKTKLGCV